MAQNKNALIRYRTIDKCLQNYYRQWTLEELMDACSDALYEYEGRDMNVSKRTIQLDIQLMRSDKLGYNAPIVVYDKKYYKYEDPDYSITDIPLNENDMQVLTETVEMLKQFKDFSLFSELGGIIQRLEDRIYTEKTHQPSIIHLDKNEQLKGLEHLDVLYQAILKKIVLKIQYQSFRAEDSSEIIFHPFILKEFNNRWFLIGKTKKQAAIITLALDRMVSIDYDLKTDHISEPFDGDAYYKNTIGVTVLDQKFVTPVVLKVDRSNAPYVLTKPLHHSQQVMEELVDGSVIIKLLVHNNYELERLILGFGDSMQVLKPSGIRRKIQEKLENALDFYKSQISKSEMVAATRKLEKNGISILNDVYTRKEIRQIGRLLHNFFDEKNLTSNKVNLIVEVPELKVALFNQNLRELLNTIAPNAFIIKSSYFDKASAEIDYDLCKQRTFIHVNKKIETEGFSSWTKESNITCVHPPDEVLKSIFILRIYLDESTIQNGVLKVIPRTHSKRFSDQEIEAITSNVAPTSIEVRDGSVLLMNPLLIHTTSKPQNQKRKRVIHLEFSSMELPSNLDWLERVKIKGL